MKKERLTKSRLTEQLRLERTQPQLTAKKVSFDGINQEGDCLVIRENRRRNEAKEVVGSLVKGSLGLIGLGTMFLASAKALNYLDRKVFHVGMFYNKEEEKKDNEKEDNK